MNAVCTRACIFCVAISIATPGPILIAADSMTISSRQHASMPAAYEANDNVIWDNGPAGGGGNSSQIDSIYPFHSQVADDFRLRDQNPGGANKFIVTEVSWIGIYWGGAPGNPNHGFNVLVYDDAGGLPTGAGPVDPSGTALLSQFIPLRDTNEASTGITNEFSYEAKLVLPFQADADTPYWIGIQSVMIFAPQWGWKASADGVHGNASRQGFPILGNDYWDNILADQSFQLSGFEVPEPTGMALLAAGGWALLRRRR